MLAVNCIIGGPIFAGEELADLQNFQARLKSENGIARDSPICIRFARMLENEGSNLNVFISAWHKLAQVQKDWILFLPQTNPNGF